MALAMALVGNPNCGKTTIFNVITGSSQYVGNWPGVTVEKKGGNLLHYKDVEVMDLPGIYSLSPYSMEEVVTRDYLVKERPNVIINIIDASNLERNLYLTTQVLELGLPVIVALNMMDVVEAKGDKIDVEGLANLLGCEVIPVQAINNKGMDELIQRAIVLGHGTSYAQPLKIFNANEESCISDIEEHLPASTEPNMRRYWAIKYFERDEKVMAETAMDEQNKHDIEEHIRSLEDAVDDDAQSIVTNARYSYINSTLRQCIKTKQKLGDMSHSDKIDLILTNRAFGLPIFFLIMWGVYYLSVQSIGDMGIEFMGSIFDYISSVVQEGLTAMGVSETLRSLVVDGIIGGVGAVLTFVPQIMVLFLLLSFLEDCGYMARVAFIMDRIFRKFGLSGKSFIPLLVGTGCTVPGVMSSRTIENIRDRRMTVMLTPFIPCSTKMPIFALFAAAMFPNQSWVAPSMYFWGIGLVIFSGIILKKTSAFGGKPAPFVMELPQYHMPTVRNVLTHMWERARGFIMRAGTVIFLASTIVWFLQNFNTSLQMVGIEESMLAGIGRFITPIFVPLGFDRWEATVAAISGLIAKEVIVATFAILAGVSEESSDMLGVVQNLFTPASAYAFMLFILLAAPCVAAIAAIRREMGNWSWTAFAVTYQTVVAYIIATLVYQIGKCLL